MIGIDLFSGAGGLSLGAEMAGVNVAIAVESDPYAAQTYRVNHPRTLIINAFETLYSKHDATKAGYRRELRSSLSYDSFKKVFAYFCFITYYQDKIELTHDEVLSALKKINKIEFDAEDYIFDLVNSICVLYRDGLNYKFTHRSFQEYFTAIFLKDLPDQNMKTMGMELIKKDYFKASHDNVFAMLHDMAEQRFEQNILLPLVIEFESTCQDDNKYDFYFEKLSPAICFDYVNDDDKTHLMLCVKFSGSAVDFLYTMAGYYIKRDSRERIARVQQAVNKLETYLLSERDYSIGEQFEAASCRGDPKAYSLVKDTWIGETLCTMSRLGRILEERKREEAIDLSSLLT